MTKQLKINKQMKMSPDRPCVHTGMKLAAAPTPTERGRQGERGPTEKSCTGAGSYF